jgi:peptide/nickel transport system permease protein
MFPVLSVVAVVVFSLVHLTPGDPAAVYLGPEATPEQIADLRARLALDEPFFVQFAMWSWGVLRLDFGDSLFIGKPVTEALVERAQPTLLLTFYGLITAIIVGVPAGAIAAIKQNSLIDRLVMVSAISGTAMPGFVLGILLILAFSVRLGWLPSGGYTDIHVDPVDHFKRMILPSVSLGVSIAGLFARLVRSSMLDVLQEDYVRTAIAKGLAFRAVIVRHALRNALIPVITVIGYTLGTLLGGAVVTETVFTLPGMGRLVVQSVGRRDYPIVQGAVIMIAGFAVLANLIVDIMYVYIDPRIRYDE